MNLNLFLRPGDAQREMKMKLDAQKRALENALIDIGYDTLMKEVQCRCAISLVADFPVSELAV